MQTIVLTGGYGPGSVVVDVAPFSGVDLSTATYKLALVPEGGPYPPLADTAWQAVTVAADHGLHLPVTATTTPGHYHVWLQITVGGSSIPVRVLDADGTPFLVYVT